MKTKSKIFNWTIFNLIIFNLISLQSTNAQMFWNQTTSFAGSPSSYVSVPNSSSLNLTGSFSLEAWVNPSNTNIKGIMSKGGAIGTFLKYGLRITSSRVQLITNGASRLSSKTLIPINTWSHICATYDSAFSLFRIYVNGVSDTSVIIAGSSPDSNTDSLFIGISGSSTPFTGQIDELRIWNRSISSTEVQRYFRTSLGTSSGVYNGLVLSMPFQKESSAGIKFSLKDYSDFGNNGRGTNVNASDEDFRPLHTISQNECAEFDGVNDYLAGRSNGALSPVSAITVECWVYPRSSGSYTIISKGNSYTLSVINDLVIVGINTFTLTSSSSLALMRWSRIAFTYDDATDSIKLLVNVSSPNQLFNSSIGSINSNTDSLYIGGVPGSTNDLNGFVDEVRISNYAKKLTQLDDNLYKSIDASNDPGISTIDVSYGLNGCMLDNTEDGGPKLFFRNNARFSHPARISNQPVSPVNRNLTNTFTDGFYIEPIMLRIPISGTSGFVNRTSLVSLNTVITDINLFVALNHTSSSNLEIVLKGPNNDSVKVFDNGTSNSRDNNIVTVFDDNADSSLIDERYSSFYTTVKPENSLNSVFAGDNSKGLWTITVRDVASGDTGVFYSWGIQFNNQSIRQKDIDCDAYLQGFYRSSIHRMITSDTIKAYLRNFNSPYAIIDSSKSILTSSGASSLSFANASDNIPYYLIFTHRNTIETWSSTFVKFRTSETSYNFSDLSSAFGDNLIMVDPSPLRYAVFSGDSNQDGVVDATDLGLIDNDAFNFVTGYVQTDLTGDEVVDASDASITDNNASNFVTAITP